VIFFAIDCSLKYTQPWTLYDKYGWHQLDAAL